MNAGLLFCNAKMKAAENSLLTNDRLIRLADQTTVSDALRQLVESGYPAGQDDAVILRAAENEAYELLRSLMPSGYGLECFFVMNDYHNAKCIAKEILFGASAEDSLKPTGLADLDLLRTAISEGKTEGLYSALASAIIAIKEKFDKAALTPGALDAAFDKAAFADLAVRLNSAHKTIKKYFATLADLSNISVVYRASKHGYKKERAAEMLVACGTLSEEEVLNLFGLTTEEMVDKYRYAAAYRPAFEALDKGMVDYEVYRDNTLLSILKADKYDMFSPAVAAGYIVGKQREILNCRLIISAIRSGVDMAPIKARMRELYV